MLLICVFHPESIARFLDRSDLGKLSAFGISVERKASEIKLASALQTVNEIPRADNKPLELETQPVNPAVLQSVVEASAISPDLVPSSGWVFLGRVKSNQREWEDTPVTTIERVALPIQSGSVVTITDDAYLRADVPASEYKSSGKVISVARVGSKFEIERIEPKSAKIGGFYLWAKVHELSKR